MKKLAIAILIGVTATASSAQTDRRTYNPNQSYSVNQRNYISVMSKAGTPQARPEVPVRYVNPPAGARYGTFYYYGYPRADSYPVYQNSSQHRYYNGSTRSTMRNNPYYESYRTYQRY